MPDQQQQAIPLREIAAGLDAGERAVLMQLTMDRPTEDGNIIGKAQRNRLIGREMVLHQSDIARLKAESTDAR